MARLKKIVCEDGSLTFLNADIGEHYHSTSGASSEARQKHAIPADLLRRCEQNGGIIRILDFAFGLGYNSAAALEILMDSPLCKEIEITALEIDREIIARIPGIKSDIRNFPVIGNFAKNFLSSAQIIRPYIYKEKNVTLMLFLEDAASRLKRLKNNYYDVVFFDPFSSGRAPDLWKEEIFRRLSRILKTGGALTTYSCARHFRRKLEKAGFEWRDVPPGFERRGPSTLALKK